MKTIYYLPIFLMVFVLSAQNINPGGVKGANFWILGNESQGNVRFNSPLQQDFEDAHPENENFYTLNNNPAKYISEDSYSFIINDINDDKMSIFCVYQLEDTLSENHIWSLSHQQNLNYELSSYRFADLNEYKYRDLRVFSQKYPELHSFIQHKDSTISSEYRLQIGAKSSLENLPIQNFKGILPELIIFPRTLSNRDKQKVESYLGIKYGLNISAKHPMDYLNSGNQTWWSAKDNQQYHHRVFAVARDDSSGLNQIKSHSAYAPYLLEIAYSNGLPNQDLAAIFVADNGKSMKLSTTENGNPFTTLRHWRISSEEFAPIDLNLNLEEIVSRNEDEFLYLQIDALGNPDESFFPKRFIQIPKDVNMLTLESFEFDNDINGADIFTIAQAPDLFVQMDIDFPRCGISENGKIKTKVEGGQAPFTVTLKSNTGEIIQDWVQYDNEEIFEIENLSLGDYVISVNDANGHSYTNSFYMQSEGISGIPLQSTYDLIEGEKLEINAAAGMYENAHYQWYKGNKLISSQAKITITEGGEYELRMTTASGCTNRNSFEVITQSAENIKSFDIFPNPSKGDYSVRIILERPDEVVFDVFDMHGRKLKTQNLGTDNYFLIRDHIAEIGAYILQISTSNEKQSKKLIVSH